MSQVNKPIKISTTGFNFKCKDIGSKRYQIKKHEPNRFYLCFKRIYFVSIDIKIKLVNAGLLLNALNKNL